MILVGFLLICVDMESSVELHYFRFMDWKCRLWQRGRVLVQTKPLQHRPTRGRSRPRAAGEELFTLFCDFFLLFHSAQTKPSSCCIDRRGAAGSILVKWPAVLPPMTFLESETNPALAQKSRQMWFNKVFLSQLCFGREPGCLVTLTLLEDICFNFRLASSPRMSASDQMRAMLDQLMGTQRNGEWQNPPDQEVIPQFNTNLNPCQIPISVGCLKFFLFDYWLPISFIFFFVHIGSNFVQHVKIYFSRPDILWKFWFLAVVCNTFNTQVFIPRNTREKK